MGTTLKRHLLIRLQTGVYQSLLGSHLRQDSFGIQSRTALCPMSSENAASSIFNTLSVERRLIGVEQSVALLLLFVEFVEISVPVVPASRKQKLSAGAVAFIHSTRAENRVIRRKWAITEE